MRAPLEGSGHRGFLTEPSFSPAVAAALSLQPCALCPHVGQVGLGGRHMRLNASLAVALAAAFEGQWAQERAAQEQEQGLGVARGGERAAQEQGLAQAQGLAEGGPSAAVAAERSAAVR